jgi:hypothetical protein
VHAEAQVLATRQPNTDAMARNVQPRAAGSCSCRAYRAAWKGFRMASFSLVDLSNGDRVAEYTTASAALEEVWEVITLGGEHSVAGIRREYGDSLGRTKVLAEGAGLIKLAALTHLRHN